MKRNRGFTLAELLIVIAVIGVLVAVSIPIFHAQLEKARRAVDLHTARSVESILAAAVNDGTIELTEKNDGNKPSGIWVVLVRDSKSWPESYKRKNAEPFFGVDEGTKIRINGKENTSNWDVSNKEIEKILTDAGMTKESLKVTSKDNKKDGWDWIVIEVVTYKHKIFTRIYSGFAGQTSDVSNSAIAGQVTNIEKLIG